MHYDFNINENSCMMHTIIKHSAIKILLIMHRPLLCPGWMSPRAVWYVLQPQLWVLWPKLTASWWRQNMAVMRSSKTSLDLESKVIFKTHIFYLMFIYRQKCRFFFRLYIIGQWVLYDKINKEHLVFWLHLTLSTNNLHVVKHKSYSTTQQW